MAGHLKETVETSEVEVIVEEKKPGVFKRIGAKVASIPAKAKYIAAGVAGAAAVAIAGAVVGMRAAKHDTHENWDSDMTIEDALAIDPDVLNESD